MKSTMGKKIRKWSELKSMLLMIAYEFLSFTRIVNVL